jgi:hypothetical protein
MERRTVTSLIALPAVYKSININSGIFNAKPLQFYFSFQEKAVLQAGAYSQCFEQK